MGFYTTAQICLNGHAVTSDIRCTCELETYCSKCGAKTLTACPNCGTPIRGKYDAVGEPVIPYRYSPPAYCRNCGAPFPWIKAALPDILNDSPRTTLAATRIAKYLKKLAPTVQETFKQIFYRIAAEYAKILIWSP